MNSSATKKILLIAQSFPSDRSCGTSQRTGFLYDALSSFAEVYVVVAVGSANDEKLDFAAKEQCVCLRTRDRRLSRVYSLLNSTFWRLFPQVYITLHSQELAQKIFPGVDFDFVVVRYTQLLAKFVPWCIAPVYVDIDDHPIESFLTQAKGKMSWLRIQGTVFCLRIWSWYLYSKCRGGWIANSDQVKSIPLPVRGLFNLAVPPQKSYKQSAEPSPYLLTVGNLGYPPNFKGLDSFLSTFWEQVRAVYPFLQYKIVGGGLPPCYRERWGAYDGVELLGFIEDLAPLYEKCLMSSAPINSGSGTCIKVIESLLHSRMCLVTPFALRGIQKEMWSPENGVWVYGCLDDVLFAIDKALNQRQFVELCQRGARRFAEERFGYEEFRKVVASAFCEDE